MKKETLEEAFNKIVDSSDYVLFDYASFEEGAKWQAERSYSEEEVRNIANWAFGFYRRNDLSDSELEDEFNKILEKQFKN